MDPRKNPYAPGAGLQPPELAGRNELLQQADVAMDRVLARRPTRGMMLLGLRGVGKTVLLNRLKRTAESKGFHAAKIESPESGDLPQQIAPELRRIIYDIDVMAAAAKKAREAVGALVNFISAFKVKVGEIEFGIEPKTGVADTGILAQDLPQLLVAVGEVAAEAKTAVALFIDEVQYLSTEELTALIIAAHEVSQKELPMWIVGAGLPQTAALAGNAKSYAERLFSYPEVGALDPKAAKEALVKPAKANSVEYTEEAIEKILDVTECYPYFLQEWGAHVWDFAQESPIKGDDVDNVMDKVIHHLDKNFFRVRFDRLTPLQQKYMRAMAELGPGPHKTGDIAAVLGVRPSSVSVTRQQLIEKGMIWSQRHGETAFTVPMFDSFMRRQMPLEKHVPKQKPAAKKGKTSDDKF